MNHNISGLVLFGLPVIGTVILFFLWQGIKKAWNLFYFKTSYRNFRASVLNRTSNEGVPIEKLQFEVSGKKDFIIDEFNVQMSCNFIRRIDGLVAWVRLGTAYLTDNRENLNMLLGKKWPGIVWFPNAPVQKINNQYIRKPLSIIFGIITFWNFILLLLPPIWLYLILIGPVGPYWALNMSSVDNKVKWTLEGSKQEELTRPVILKAGSINTMYLTYKPILYLDLFSIKQDIKHAKIYYLKECPKLVNTNHRQFSGFTWKANDVLRLKIRGKMRKFSVKLGEGYINVRL